MVPCNRNLVGADVRAWYDEMPKKTRADEVDAIPNSPRTFTNKTILPNIEEHFLNPTFLGICEGCRMTPQETVSGLLSRLRIAEERLKTGYQICASCTESVPSEPIKCESLDCPWFFERKKAEVKAENAILIHTLLDGMEVGEWKSSFLVDRRENIYHWQTLYMMQICRRVVNSWLTIDCISGTRGLKYHSAWDQKFRRKDQVKRVPRGRKHRCYRRSLLQIIHYSHPWGI